MNNYGSRYYEDEELDELKGRREPSETPIQRAAKAIDAVEVAGRYARYDAQDQRWCVGTVDSEGSWGNKRWLPSWWTPERRFAIRLYPEGTLRLSMDGSRVATFTSMEQAHVTTIYGDKDRVVTVDLETGAEIPA